MDDWRKEFQYLLDGKILSRDELASLFGQIKSILDRENKQQVERIKELYAGVLQVVADSNQAQIEASKRIRELEAENKQLSRDYYCVGTLCNSIDEFGEPIKEEQWTELGERIYEIVAGQLQRTKELEAKCDNCVYLEADKEIINEHIEKEKVLEERIKELEVKL